MNQKTVFLSYRRSVSRHLARAIYQDLKAHDWDVFLDVDTIDSGDFDKIILNQIGARAHFILLISPDSLRRCVNVGDWVLREIEEAVQLERNIIPIFEQEANLSQELSYLPDSLRETISKKSGVSLPHDYFEAAMEKLRSRFLKIPEYVTITEVPEAERVEVKRRLSTIDAPPITSRVPAILPDFEWIDIPAGKVTLEEDYHDDSYIKKGQNQTFDVPAFTIAKYPITNEQYAEYVKETGKKPQYWDDSRWNDPMQPVVGVTWLDVIAFCEWLSEKSGEEILLPTEQQWQRAAQGDDGRAYPWGNDWDGSRCNNNVDKKGIGKTSLVTAYEGKGNSPYGVVDMAGNVWEWCLTNFDTGSQEVDKTSVRRVLRGGSWYDFGTIILRASDRYRGSNDFRNYVIGFRLSRSYTPS